MNEMYGSSEQNWIVVPPAYAEHSTTFGPFGPFTQEEARNFMSQGDYAVNLTDHPNWFNTPVHR